MKIFTEKRLREHDAEIRKQCHEEYSKWESDRAKEMEHFRLMERIQKLENMVNPAKECGCCEKRT